MDEALADRIKVIGFDVFGTVVDWYGSVTREVAAQLPGVDAGAFVTEWRAGYYAIMGRVRRGELPFSRIDDLHRMLLDDLLARRAIDLDEATRVHLNRAWHRLDPWPDAVRGLQRLRARFMVCTLSNGNLGLLANMAKRAGLPWDLILSAEVFGHFKPEPQAYLGLSSVFGLQPAETMLVATHKADLRGAKRCGLATAYVERPLEEGPGVTREESRDPAFDLHATDFGHLADQLGC